jgi:hypothetical protein
VSSAGVFTRTDFGDGTPISLTGLRCSGLADDGSPCPGFKDPMGLEYGYYSPQSNAQFFAVKTLLAWQVSRCGGTPMHQIYAGIVINAEGLPPALREQGVGFSRSHLVNALNDFGARQRRFVFQDCKQCSLSGSVSLVLDATRIGPQHRHFNLVSPALENCSVSNACMRSDFAFLPLPSSRALLLAVYNAAAECAKVEAGSEVLTAACAAARDAACAADKAALAPLRPLLEVLAAGELPAAIAPLLRSLASSSPQAVCFNYDAGFVTILRALESGAVLQVAHKHTAAAVSPLLAEVLSPLVAVPPWLAPILRRLCEMGEAHGRRIVDRPAEWLPAGVVMERSPVANAGACIRRHRWSRGDALQRDGGGRRAGDASSRMPC